METRAVTQEPRAVLRRSLPRTRSRSHRYSRFCELYRGWEPQGTLVFLLYQKGRDSRIFQAQDGYDRRDSEQQQVTADEDRGRLVRRP